MNHCISFIWSSLDKVEGWNSLSIHFFAAASSANAGAVTAADAAISATALVIIKTRVLTRGPLLRSKCRMLIPPLQRQTYPGPGLIPDLLFFASQTVRKIATAETSEITVASHRLDNSIPSPTGSVAILSVPANPLHTRWITAGRIT